MGSQRHAPAALYPREKPGTHCTGGWVGPGPVWTGAENLAPTGIRFLDRPARSQSLHRARYPAHATQILVIKWASPTSDIFDILLNIFVIVFRPHKKMLDTVWHTKSLLNHPLIDPVSATLLHITTETCGGVLHQRIIVQYLKTGHENIPVSILQIIRIYSI